MQSVDSQKGSLFIKSRRPLVPCYPYPRILPPLNKIHYGSSLVELKALLLQMYGIAVDRSHPIIVPQNPNPLSTYKIKVNSNNDNAGDDVVVRVTSGCKRENQRADEG